MQATIRFIGLDVHKAFISVAIADEGRDDVTSYGDIANTPAAVSKLARKLSRQSLDLCFVYEAGCFGQGNRIKIMSSHWLQKWLFRQ